jgi:hypothetical protein
MASNLQCNFIGLSSALGTAAAAVSPNTRVTATLGPLATLADVVTFPTGIGNWIQPATRCSVGGLPAVDIASLSLVTGPSPPFVFGPMVVTSPDPRSQGT